MTVAIDWENLGFAYMKLPYRYIAHYKNGQWDQGELTEDATLHISESSPSLHYGQQAFEGLKAYRTKDGSVQLFRSFDAINFCCLVCCAIDYRRATKYKVAINNL